MNMLKNEKIPPTKPVGADFFDSLWEKSWTYIKTVVNVAQESVLILDKNFHVIAANKSFYQLFQAKPKETEGVLVYELGDGQWNIPALKNLLEEILPKKTFFKGFEVAHEFPLVGHKVILLNARQIHIKGDDASELFPPIILLAMEDITEMMVVAETFADIPNQMEATLSERTQKLETTIEKLEKEIQEIKNKS